MTKPALLVEVFLLRAMWVHAHTGGEHDFPCPSYHAFSGNELDRRNVPAVQLARCKKNKVNIYPRCLGYTSPGLYTHGLPTPL